MQKKKILKKILQMTVCVVLLWSTLVTVDFFRLTGAETYKEPLIPMGGIHYAYDYSMLYGLGYAVCYAYGGDETYDIKKISFQVFGNTIYERDCEII